MANIHFIYTQTNKSCKPTKVSIANPSQEVFSAQLSKDYPLVDKNKTAQALSSLPEAPLYCERFHLHKKVVPKLSSTFGLRKSLKIQPIEKLIPQVSLNEWKNYKDLVFQYNPDLKPEHSTHQALVTAVLCDHLVRGDEPGIYQNEIREWCQSLNIPSAR